MKHSNAVAVATGLALALWVAPSAAQDAGGMDMESAGQADSMKMMGAHMHSGPHMTMTEARPVTPEDIKRAQELLKTMRGALVKYKDYNAATAEGYEPFMPTVPQDIYHFSNRSVTAAEYLGDFDAKHPGSLLYRKKTFGGYELVGAMYSAPETATPEELDKMIPLSVGTWHSHTNICVPKGVSMADIVKGDVQAGAHVAGAMDPQPGQSMGLSHGRNTSARLRWGYLADDRFGFIGRISNAQECESARGQFFKQMFGWMIHVYPFAGDDLKVAFSTDAP